MKTTGKFIAITMAVMVLGGCALGQALYDGEKDKLCNRYPTPPIPECSVF